MADDVVDRGAHALWVAFVVEVGRRTTVLDGVVVDHLVDLVGGHACGDVLAYVVEHAYVDGGGALDALDIGGRLVERAGQNLPALFPQALEALIKGAMAFLIFLPLPHQQASLRPGTGPLSNMANFLSFAASIAHPRVHKSCGDIVPI